MQYLFFTEILVRMRFFIKKILTFKLSILIPSHDWTLEDKIKMSKFELLHQQTYVKMIIKFTILLLSFFTFYFQSIFILVFQNHNFINIMSSLIQKVIDNFLH